MIQPWHIEAIQNLLDTPVIELEPGMRVYTASKRYGESRYHLLNKRSDGVQIEQVNVDDKWGSRVTLHSDELPALIKTLLTWHLEALKEEQGQQQQDDALGDLDEHPF